jgi:hypothetical protein
LEQELAKYDKYKSDLEDGEREQEKLLEEIEVCYSSVELCIGGLTVFHSVGA